MRSTFATANETAEANQASRAESANAAAVQGFLSGGFVFVVVIIVVLLLIPVRSGVPV